MPENLVALVTLSQLRVAISLLLMLASIACVAIGATAPTGTIHGLPFLGAGVLYALLVVVAGVLAWRRARLLVTGTRTTGKVVRVEPVKRGPDRLIFEFRDANGVRHELVQNATVRVIRSLPPGSPLVVAYDPKKPHRRAVAVPPILFQPPPPR
ncbi:MAG: DUF3592 domain-containing protein [Myxococcaceae bacterium]|nr:DUF3592 domain-containing protein [Myxococcaceae bacterium]